MTTCLVLALFGVRATAQTLTLKVWADDITITADGQTVTHLTVYETDNVDYSAFNMAITLPKGVSVAKVKKGRNWVDDIELNADRFEGLDHTIACNMPDEKTLKVMCYSNTLSEIYPDNADGDPVEELFTIGLIADPTTINGDYEAKILDCAFTPASGSASELKTPSNFTITITGGADGATINYNLYEPGYGTLILPFDATLPEGLTAYTCTGVDNNHVQTEQQTSIQANVPLLIVGTPGTYEFTGVPTNSNDSYSYGVFTGVFTSTVVTSGYVLQNQNDIIGFYPINANKPITVPAYRCYLSVPQNASALMIDGIMTGIENIQGNSSKGELYDVNGRRVKRATSTGVYIEEGKKVLIKK